jgi:hypothetical protein
MAILKNTEAMMEKFDKLYQKMSVSDKVEDMKLFGKVMREAVRELASVRPEIAEELIEELSAIEWKNYLTRREAEEIVSKMEPEAKWSRDQLERSLRSDGLMMEEEPYYNDYALWVEVSKIYSDSGRTLREHLERAGMGSESELVKLIYGLAIDHLKDRDGVFDIRKYFGI